MPQSRCQGIYTPGTTPGYKQCASCAPMLLSTNNDVPFLQDAETSWQFDAFQLSEATDGQPLSVLTFHLLEVSTHAHQVEAAVSCHPTMDVGS